MRPVTLCYCLRNDDILMAMKKRGFGVGKLNGYGGKVQSDESILEAALRELEEESGLVANTTDFVKVAIIDFYFDDVPPEKDFNQTVHVFLLKKWVGEPCETEEMKPYWFKINALPENMWIDDIYWLPTVLRGEKLKAEFRFMDSGKRISSHKINILEQLD